MTRTRTRKAQVGFAAISSRVSEAVDHIRDVIRTRPWWHTTLLVIGVVASLTAVGVLFLGFNNAPRTISTSQPVPPVHSREFAAGISRLVNAPIERGGTVEVLNNGDEFLPALLKSLNGARSSINFSVFIWEKGAFGTQVLDALIAQQSRGVAVRVLLDGYGARYAPDDRFAELEKLGGRVESFRTPKFGTWTRIHRRNHRRSIVIDGEIGFTGGMAVSDKWLGHAQDPDHWRDLMFKVTGPLAASLQAAFVDAWVSSSGEILLGRDLHEEAGMAPSAGPAGVDRFIHHVNSPADDDQSMAYFFLLPVLAARERVSIATPYFIPDEPLKHALEEKARSGVDVRLLLPGRHIDNHTARWSGQNHYDDLMRAGVKIYEYRPTFTHAKYVVVDGQWSIVGSPNLNSRSRQLDEENAFGILDAGLAGRLETIFSADLERADEITIDAWRRRGPIVRALQFFSRMLDQQS
jgi:cardiolipin synthase